MPNLCFGDQSTILESLNLLLGEDSIKLKLPVSWTYFATIQLLVPKAWKGPPPPLPNTCIFAGQNL